LKLPTHFGLDVNGGLRAVLQAQVTPGMSAQYDQDTVEHILENRLNASGVAEPQIYEKGQTQFIVELPNVRNKDQIIQQLQTTAQMQLIWFRDVVSKHNPGARYRMNMTNDAQGREVYSFTDTMAPGATFRDQYQIVNDFQNQVLLNSLPHAGANPATIPAPLNQFAPQGRVLYLDSKELATVQALNTELQAWDNFYNMELQASGTLTNSPPQPVVSGANVKPTSTASIDSSKGAPEPCVNLNFDDKGSQQFGDFTRDHVNDILAILLDGRVLSAPNIIEPILDGACEISGGFADLTEAQSLANLLNAGALPVPLTIEEDETVEATLGHSAVQHMILAGVIGLCLVLAFMLFYYLLPGLVADIALICYALFAMAIFKGGLSWFIPPVTLTLPGIAGFILSVGMAVDANILIFERLKEELRNGKSLRQAIDAGFRRAFTAIRDSNICTLITCVILYSMGSESVKGFALTLGIGVCVSLFTAITATRSMLYILVDLGLDKYPSWFGLKRQWVTGSHASETAVGAVASPSAGSTPGGVNVMRNRYWFYGLSLLIIIPGIIAWSMGGLKRSIEFTGGTQVEVVFNAPATQAQVRNAVVAGGFKDNLVQMGSANGKPIAFISVKDRGTYAYTAVETALSKANLDYTLQSHSLVGGIISKELTTNAFQAVIIAACLIVLYMAFAFSIGGFVAGLRFGTSAIIALLHDVLVLIGSFAILGLLFDWQIDSLFVTATLTVVGFSVHDTIVIFDRLRENLRHRLKSDSFEDLANRSILQSFARSINTSFTVVLTLCALLIWGEPSTRLLNVALLIGIISGTYSSIFNATPILVDWENLIARMQGRKFATADSVAASISAPPAGQPGGSRPAPKSGNGASADAEDKSPATGQTVAPGRPTVTRTKKKAPRRF
jgi:SecD/SecF fusion protein